MKLFYLVRNEDVSGVSGTGVVAEGVIYFDGQVSMKWKAEVNSLVVYKNIRELEIIHGHGGRTKIVYLGEYT